LVDDSYLNRLVAINSLTYYGMIITEADNGIKAIELLNESSFDLILMDLQMPELGGLETTRIIRDEMGFKIPIIALTANVFRSELERCMSAGMNDYITKPFDEGALLAVLVKNLIQDENQKDRSNVLSGHSYEMSYDLGSIHAMSRGNKEFVQKMVNIFCDETPLIISQIRKAWESDNYVEMKRLAHRLKPSLANFGIKSATDSVKVIEKYDETSQSASFLSEYILRLETVTENVIRQLESEKL
jgi:CheY-like chemotaxis protein/HPt (histidine-containing phosphotransfer) domain-containing protein